MSDLTMQLMAFQHEVRTLEVSERSDTHIQLIALVDLVFELSRKLDKSEEAYAKEENNSFRPLHDKIIASYDEAVP